MPVFAHSTMSPLTWAGAEVKENWEQWAAQQADLQSLDGFCFSPQTVRPASAQSPYSPGRRQRPRARPASAAAPAAGPARTPQLWSRLTGSQQDASPKQPVATEASGQTEQASSSAGHSHAADVAAQSKVKDGKVLNAACAAKTSQASSAAAGSTRGQSASQQSQPGGTSASPQPVTKNAEAAAAAGKAEARKGRPATAQPQVQSPGVFLRSARPQSAGAANVSRTKSKTVQVGVHAFNEPKPESGWVDFRAQNRMGNRVGLLSHVGSCADVAWRHAKAHICCPFLLP